MKTEKNKVPGLPVMAWSPIVMVLLLLTALSCRKNDSSPVAPVEMQNIAIKLQGEIINGGISTESDEDGIALWCNDGKVLIGIGKISSQACSNPGNIAHAQVVYSNFGVIIHDTDTNKSWYYIQNDEESQQRFGSLPAAGENPVISGIAGTIRLNLSQSS